MIDSLRLDASVRCGVLLAANTKQRLLHSARRTEALGFDSAWVGDHVAFHVPIPDSLSVLAFAAAVTQRITLGTAVYLLPLRHPTLTAKTVATLDSLSGGRLVLGVGVGGEFAPEFEACGVPLGERGSRSDEAIDVLRKLWSEERVAHEGRHFRFGAVSIEPRPATPGGPPLWIGGRRPPAFRRAGRRGDGYVSHMTSPETYRANLEAIGSHAREAGRGELAFATAALLFTALDDAYESALERAASRLGRLYARPFRDAARKYCLLGRPEDCLDQLRRFVDAGCRHFVLAPLSDPDEFLERVAAEMLEEVRALRP